MQLDGEMLRFEVNVLHIETDFISRVQILKEYSKENKELNLKYEFHLFVRQTLGCRSKVHPRTDQHQQKCIDAM